MDYLITMDIVETLAHKYSIKDILDNPQLMEKIEDLQTEFVEKFKTVLPDNLSLKVIPASILSKEIIKAVKDIKREQSNSLTVSLDRIYMHIPDVDFQLEVTRETDPISFDITIAPRYGFPLINEQIEKLKTDIMSKGEKNEFGIILVDVGMAGGDTLKNILFTLENKGIKINGIVLGLCQESNYMSLLRSYGNKIKVVNESSWANWDEARDLFLIDGIQIPKSYSKENVKRFVPYTEDTVVPLILPDEKLQTFKDVCNEANVSLLKILKEHKINTKAIGKPFYIDVWEAQNAKKTRKRKSKN
jgi:hypothetical protein